ncbi:MAG: hypothetical protein ABSH28_07240 [Acidobacteriota bacterium]
MSRRLERPFEAATPAIGHGLSASPFRIPWVPCVLLILLGLGFYTCTSLDDIFLTYWPAHTLATHARILNYNGQYLEQSSSLFHTILLAGLAKLTRLPLPLLGYYVAFLFGLLTLVASYKLAANLNNAVSGSSCALLLATAPYFVYYSVNSLEATFTAFLVVLLIIGVNRYLTCGTGFRFFLISIPGFLLVRPEAFLLLVIPVIVLFALLLVPISTWRTQEVLSERRRLILTLLIATLIQLLICGFRYFYFGDYVPQTVRAKISALSPARLRNGFQYLFGRTPILGPDNAVLIWSIFFGIVIFAVLLIGSFVFLRQMGVGKVTVPGALFPYLFCACYISYVVLVGGDWMESGRFLVPVLPLVFALLTVIVNRYAPWRILYGVSIPILLLVVFNILGNYYYATRVSRGSPLLASGTRAAKIDQDLVGFLNGYSWVEIVSRGHLRDIPVIAAIEKVIAAQPSSRSLSLMSHQGGMINFYVARSYFRRVQFVDLAGLFSRHVSGCPEVIDMGHFQTPFNSGTIIPWDFYFSHKKELQSCGIPEPDIIFDLYFDNGIFPLLAQNGYEVVFKSLGYIRDRTFLGNDYGPATEFVAVKKDLVPAQGGYPIVWDWDQKWH